MRGTLTRPTFLLALGLACALGWDFSGLDLHVARHLGSAQGFAAQHAFWAETLLHDGVRKLLGLAVVLSAALIWRREGRARRVGALLAALLATLAVNALKATSLTSCPWSLAEFGGEPGVEWVSHWQWAVADGGPGHCFPSGHSAGVFALWCLVPAWTEQARWRRLAWLAVGLLGAAASAAQWARGAHFVSHSLWSAWGCAAWAFALQLAMEKGLWARNSLTGPSVNRLGDWLAGSWARMRV